jgi:prevent-host-death family protein
MEIPVSEAKAQLTELVHLAETGEDIRLTRHGRAVARIIPVAQVRSQAQKRRLLDQIIAEARGAPSVGADAARSQDFLYGDDGMPE